MRDKNYYEILGIAPSASERAIKAQFRKLMKLCHPDVSKSPDAETRYVQVMEAYRTLSDKDARAAYDLSNNLGGVSSASSCDSPPSADSSAASSPRGETTEDRREYYKRLLREKRANEQTRMNNKSFFNKIWRRSEK
jgi:curved DNA-binding protein